MFQIDKILEDLANEINVGVQSIMATKGLTGSKLQKSVSTKVTANSFELFMNDYAVFVDSGRKKFTKKVPISALLEFMKRRGITSSNGRGLKIGRAHV